MFAVCVEIRSDYQVHLSPSIHILQATVPHYELVYFFFFFYSSSNEWLDISLIVTKCYGLLMLLREGVLILVDAFNQCASVTVHVFIPHSCY